MARTRKRAYTGSKAVDKSCRSHGDCPSCQGKRIYKLKRVTPLEEDRWKIDGIRIR